MNTPRPQTSESLGWVDALRGVAILGVMMVHCSRSDLPWRVAGLNAAQCVLAGQYGVQLFFVASAFTLARSWDRRRMEIHPIKNYLLRRFFRIAPLYALGVTLYPVLVSLNLAVTSEPLPPAGHLGPAIAANLLFIHGWLPFAINNVMPGGWSIGVEMSFYLLVPWLASHLRRPLAALTALVVAMPVTALCARIFSLWGLGSEPWPVKDNTFLYYWLPTQLPVFLTGFLAYALLKIRPAVPLGPRVKAVSLLLLTASLLLLWTLSFSLGQHVPPPAWLPPALRPHIALLAPALAGLAAGGLLLSLALHPWRLLANRAMMFLGRHSYSLYVIHFLGAWTFAPWVCAHVPWSQTQPWGTLATFGAGLMACLAFSIPLAMLTHRFIEQLGMSLGKRLIRRLETRLNAPTAA